MKFNFTPKKKVEPGMHFTGIVNGWEIEVTAANEKAVTFRDCKGGAKHSVGRSMFEHLQIAEVKA